MTIFLVFFLLGYACINVFQAWLISRRKAWLAGTYMLAASSLTVAAAALIAQATQHVAWLVACGLVVGLLGAWENSKVMGKEQNTLPFIVQTGSSLVFYLLFHFTIN